MVPLVMLHNAWGEGENWLRKAGKLLFGGCFPTYGCEVRSQVTKPMQQFSTKTTHA